MASAFTHAWVGSALGVAAPARLRSSKLVALLCVASVAPDLDVIAFGLGIPYESIWGHRGFTHSIPFAAAFAACVWMFRKRSRPSEPARDALYLAGLVFAAVASHGVLDAATDGGLGVGFWIPIDDTRHFLPWRPLPVSPIGIETFFSARGLAIIAAEMRWVWAPTAALCIAVVYVRHRLSARGDGP